MNAWPVDIEPEVIERVIAWARPHDAIREVWLFGSRAKGTARPNSDVDIAIVLAPPDGDHNWAFGTYLARGKAWQQELAELAGRHVSLEAIEHDTVDHRGERVAIKKLWERGA